MIFKRLSTFCDLTSKPSISVNPMYVESDTRHQYLILHKPPRLNWQYFDFLVILNKYSEIHYGRWFMPNKEFFFYQYEIKKK